MAPFPSIHPFQERISSALYRHPTTTPTRTLQVSFSRIILPRQETVTVVPAANPNTGGSNLSSGAIAGIVIGSIVGFLLLLWIIRSCSNLGAPPEQESRRPTGWYDDVAPTSRPLSRQSRHGSMHHHHSDGGRSRRRDSSTYHVQQTTPRRPSRVAYRHERRLRKYMV